MSSDVVLTHFPTKKELVENRRKLLIRAIKGMGCVSPYDKDLWKRYEHLTKFSGNQWNEDWGYNEKLETLSADSLRELYLELDKVRK